MNDEKSRKELLEEPDPFLVFVGQMMELGKKYQKQIMAAVGAVVAVAIVITGVIYYKSKTEDRAAMMLGKAIAKYNAIKKDESSFIAYENVKKDFKNLAEKYGSTGSGKAALMQYADVCYLTKNYDEAIKIYNQALDVLGKTEFKTMLLSGLAYSYEGKMEYELAAKYFEMIASDDAAVMKDQALFNLARMYGKLGKPELEKEAFGRLVSEYPDSMYFGLASEKIAG
ncbi:MAG: tetratricopeptide repeat protein [Desulfobacteraceae bacterium]|nr:tetratricopeptide repeat protein [Desulfobacteraceae bacterium]MBC2758099.1 tetratricopeptide repeat protein [Desulfobacteraceae bacterium]